MGGEFVEGGYLLEGEQLQRVAVERVALQGAGDDCAGEPPAEPGRLRVVEVPVTADATFTEQPGEPRGSSFRCVLLPTTPLTMTRKPSASARSIRMRSASAREEPRLSASNPSAALIDSAAAAAATGAAALLALGCRTPVSAIVL